MVNIKNIFKRKKEEKLLLYNSWESVPLKVYDEIVKVTNNEDLSPMQKNIEVISLLSNIPSEEIWNMDINKVKKLSIKASFINEFDFDRNNKPKSLTINNMKCTIKYNLNDFSFAQFQDFQTFYQMGTDKYMHNILATIIIPDGKKYGDGYDLDEFTEHLYNEISITDAQTVMFFFTKSLLHSLDHTRTYLISQMKKEVKKMENSEKKKELMKQIKHITGTIV